MNLDPLALLDIEGGERFALSEAHTADLRLPSDLPWEHVARALDDRVFFMLEVAGGRSLPYSEVPLLQRSWAARHGLLDGDHLRRLLWMLQHFSAEIEYDLLQRVGVDLGELWRGRQWRKLLNLIDHFPRNTWTHQSMVENEEYAEMVGRAVAARGEPTEPWTPPLVENTPEVVVLSAVVDAVNALRATFIMANSKPGAQAPEIPPYPRPSTLVDRMAAKAQRKARWSAHEKLANRLLPHRNQQTT